QIDPTLPEALENVIRRCMAKNPNDRYPAMEAVAVALGSRTLDGTGPTAAATVFAAGTLSPAPSTLEAAATAMSIHPAARAKRRSGLTIAIAFIGAAGIAAAAFALASGGRTHRAASAPTS